MQKLSIFKISVSKQTLVECMLDFTLSITFLLGNTTLNSNLTKDKENSYDEENLCSIRIIIIKLRWHYWQASSGHINTTPYFNYISTVFTFAGIVYGK